MKVKRKMHARYLSACFGWRGADHCNEKRAAIERDPRRAAHRAAAPQRSRL
jgi:hypothetical protein